MEDTLRDYIVEYEEKPLCLNPCFNGRYSQSNEIAKLKDFNERVLILVLMEDTLRGMRARLSV